MRQKTIENSNKLNWKNGSEWIGIESNRIGKQTKPCEMQYVAFILPKQISFHMKKETNNKNRVCMGTDFFFFK